MSSRRNKKASAQEVVEGVLERPELLSHSDAVMTIIQQHAEDTIAGCELQVMKRDSEGFTDVSYPLPMDFTKDAGIESDSMKAVVWGKVLEHFEGRDEKFDIAVVQSMDERTFMLRLKWKKSIPPEVVHFYAQKVKAHFRNE